MEQKQKEQKIKPTFKLADDFLDLRYTNTNAIVDYLEKQIKLREMPVDVQMRQKSRLHNIRS